MDQLQAREKRALVHFLPALFIKTFFGQISDLEERILIIVMLYQEYDSHGCGSREEEVSLKAGQLFQGFSGRGMQTVGLGCKKE